MQGANQPKSIGPSSLGKADFDCNEFTLTVMFSHQREDLEVESRIHSSPFNMQGANQPKSIGPNSLEKADFDC
jgi:hypothetical protein